jgi:hypothetical protein
MTERGSALAAPTKNLATIGGNVNFMHSSVNVWISWRKKNEPIFAMIQSKTDCAISLIFEVSPPWPGVDSQRSHVLSVLSQKASRAMNSLLT